MAGWKLGKQMGSAGFKMNGGLWLRACKEGKTLRRVVILVGLNFVINSRTSALRRNFDS
jgi:hypothetical protein